VDEQKKEACQQASFFIKHWRAANQTASAALRAPLI
jgi:hypothetical protein